MGKNLQSSTVRSYVSAIKSVLVNDGYEWNNGKILLSSLTRSCKIAEDGIKTRLPIQKGLLEIILFEIRREYGETQPYLELLYIALFLLAYYGLLRIGELADSQHSIKARNVHDSRNRNKILLILYSSKTHGLESLPQQVKILGQETLEVTNERLVRTCHTRKDQNKETHRNRKHHFCPVDWAKRYIKARGPRRNEDENMFVYSDGSPVNISTGPKSSERYLEITKAGSITV